MNDQLQEPQVYKAVRAVGILRPKFQPQTTGRVFADALDVLGTAFWLKEYKVLITCAHVVQNFAAGPIETTGLLVIGNRGNYMRATIGAIDFTHDLAVLVLPLDTPKEIFDNESKDGLEIVDAYPAVGSGVAYAGFPLGIQLLNSTHAPTYSEGVIGAQIRHRGSKKEVQITGAVAGGFSGAPIILKDDPSKVIGVLSNTPSRDPGSTNIFMAVSWEHVKAIAELAKS